MNLVVDSSKAAQVITVRIDKLPLEYWATLRELNILRQYGAVTIALGGSIPMSPSPFTLPTRAQLFPTQLPFIERFDGADATAKSIAWAAEINSRISAAMIAIAPAYDPAADSTTVVAIDTIP